jgi:hypothetical protein
MSDETIERKYEVTAPARLVISNVRGSVTIQPGESNVIEVKAIKHGSFDNDRNLVEMTQDADGSVRVETRSNEALFGFLSHPPKVDYSVRVPQGIHLDASCISSSLKVSDLEGVFKLKTISGDVGLTKLSGPLKLGAVSGDISGSQLSGTLDLNTVSGDVNLSESSFPSVDGSTVSGDIFLQTPISAGPYHFGSVSGSIRMFVPADTHCNVELNSVSGSIRSSLPASATSMGHGMKVTQVQGGGTAVRLRSVSGGVSIETEGMPVNPVSTSSPAPESPVPPAPPVSPISPTPTAPQETLSTSEILQRIERGEMTVDEALKIMKDQS